MKPMLAYHIDIDDLQKLDYPMALQVKVEGFRAITDGNGFLSRGGKRFSNTFLNLMSSSLGSAKLDGELAFGDNFSETTSFFRSHESRGTVTYYVFDKPCKGGFVDRHAQAVDEIISLASGLHPNLILRPVPYTLVYSPQEVLSHYSRVLESAFPLNEGIILRKPNAPYKMARSTLRESYLLALKPETDLIATVTGSTPFYSESQGILKKLGALICNDGQFKIGTGFSDEERTELWVARDTLVGKKVICRHASSNNTRNPRHPVFVKFL